eukprot:TRINITY_DN8441_c0_g1_i1.p3 TRINITY_DN8441_c0_g1~~TRINITY_DN8441_c0_g1_i1.p3  ORF type:complete len:123 (-),score=22.67 TRINITY_DN8441_c0_g1_i1:643-1011(-)
MPPMPTPTLLFDFFYSCAYFFFFHEEIGRLIVAKMIEDVKHNYSTRNIFSYVTYKLLGGSPTEHPVTMAHNLTFNIFAGTSAGIFNHFWQNWKNHAFEVRSFSALKLLHPFLPISEGRGVES